MSKPITTVAAVAFDCSDPAALALFWQALLGGDITVDDDGDVRLHGRDISFIFIRVPEPKAAKNRVHLDLWGDDYEPAIAAALDAGAVVANDVYDGDRWQVLRDPEGNEFCILRPRHVD